MVKLNLKRNGKDRSMFELWSVDNGKEYLAAVIHQDMLDHFDGDYAELVMVEEEKEDEDENGF